MDSFDEILIFANSFFFNKKITLFYFIYFGKRVHKTYKKDQKIPGKNFENLGKSWNFVSQPQWEPCLLIVHESRAVSVGWTCAK